MSTHFDDVRLQVGGCSRVATMTDAAVAALASLTDLRHVDLAGCLDMTDRGNDPVPQLLCGLHMLVHGRSSSHLGQGE